MDSFERLWPSDAVLLRQIGYERSYRNGESTLGLFVNDFEPDSDTQIGDFVLPSYTGYASQDLTGEWIAPRKEAMGVYTIFAGQHVFSVTTPGELEMVYGWFVFRGTILLDAVRLFAPIVLSNGGLQLTIRPIYRQSASLAILAASVDL